MRTTPSLTPSPGPQHPSPTPLTAQLAFFFSQAVYGCNIDDVGVNTGNMNKYLKKVIELQLKDEGYHQEDIDKDWKSLAHHHNWVTCKDEL